MASYRRQLVLTATALSLLLATGCEKEPPTTVEGWAAEITAAKKPQQREDASAELKKLAQSMMRDDATLKDKVPALLPLLKSDPKIRQDIAWLLGEIGDPAAVEPLIDSLDFAIGVGRDETSRAINGANSKVAEALGKLKDKRAVRPLLKLTKSRDNFTALAAVQALGSLRDESAIDPLMELATDEHVDTFIAKNAIEALGEIGDAKALPALIKMLFRERRGVSFYREASFAIFQVGADSTPRLLEILDGKDKELLEWADGKGVQEAAIYAKTAQVLGDLADHRAVPSLMKRLQFKSEFRDLELLPRMLSAEALGRIRNRRAVKPIASLLSEEEANARGTYSRALVMLGDNSAASDLAKAAMTGFMYDGREEAQWAYARLAGPGNLKTWDRIVDTNSSVKMCMGWFEAYDEEGKKQVEAECTKRIERYKKSADKYRVMVAVTDECKKDVDCWIKKLEHQDGRIRERAAWELGRLGDLEAFEPLLSSAQEDDLEARFAVLNALDMQLFGVTNEAELDPARAQKTADRLDSILADEKGKTHYIKINEDVKRLALKVKRGLRLAKATK